MGNARIKQGETAEDARLRYNLEQKAYRALRKAQGRPLRTYYDPVSDRTNNLKRYGLTVQEFDILYAKQYGCCAICTKKLSAVNKDNPDRKSHSVIDHCHTTLSVRGILCTNCNMGLGHFKDDISLLSAAIQYLKP